MWANEGELGHMLAPKRLFLPVGLLSSMNNSDSQSLSEIDSLCGNVLRELRRRNSDYLGCLALYDI